jgi:soluble P-type ATPase
VLELRVPGRDPITVEHLVLDFNGTLAVDGVLLPGVAERIRELAGHLAVHVITADTYGGARAQTAGLPVTLQVIGPGDQTAAKRALVEALGPDSVVAVGNGANDRLMLERAALSICVLEAEGAATAALLAADVVVRSPVEALDMLVRPGRLAATLRVS